MSTMYVGSDHGGYEIKKAVVRHLRARGVTVEDVGVHTQDAADYPDYGALVARRVGLGGCEGILICTTGIGMSMVANRYRNVRAALCDTPDMVRVARGHNDANVLVLGAARLAPATVPALIDAWLEHGFSGEERHVRRVRKIDALPYDPVPVVAGTDPELGAALAAEGERQRATINLIASENYASAAVMAASGSILANKYAEGYPRKRWYNGCTPVDVSEQLAIDRACALFGCEHANVQPHSGSGANMGVYFAMLAPGDTILAMDLSHGGHLTHGSPVNFSGRVFRFVSYGVRAEDGLIDYDRVAALAEQHRPRLIVAGASAYSRTLDFRRFRAIADAVGAWLMVDMAHIAGLVAGGAHESPVPYAEFVTSTTHKTLRGPRSGLILCRAEFADAIDKQIFPGIQGGPHLHTIAAKAVCFEEALRPEFKLYAAQVVANAKAMAAVFLADGIKLVSGGTDNHLMLLDLRSVGVSGKDAANALERAGITLNKNAVPFDDKSPFVTSGIRIGTPAVTTRGMGVPECRAIADMIRRVVRNAGDAKVEQAVRAEAAALTARFPVP